MQGVRDNRAESRAHERRMLLHVGKPYTRKRSHFAQAIVPFFAEVKQTLFPFFPSKRVKLKKSTLIKTK